MKTPMKFIPGWNFREFIAVRRFSGTSMVAYEKEALIELLQQNENTINNLLTLKMKHPLARRTRASSWKFLTDNGAL